jgi:hypothetical protein
MTMRNPQNPMWRRAFDAVEEPARKRLEAAVGTAEFARVMMAALQAWTVLGKTGRAASTRLLHLANLPAHADLRRLSRQLGALEGKVDKIGAEFELLQRRLDGSTSGIRATRKTR